MPSLSAVRLRESEHWQLDTDTPLEFLTNSMSTNNIIVAPLQLHTKPFDVYLCKHLPMLLVHFPQCTASYRVLKFVRSICVNSLDLKRAYDLAVLPTASFCFLL